MMDQRVRALKIEIAQAVARKLQEDTQRDGFQVALKAVSFALCDLISVAAQSEEHRQSLIAIVNGMLNACTSVKGESALEDAAAKP
jgi:hypothetical protein